MASKLSVYNGANRILGERKLASLTENRASRRRLDSVWDGDTGVLWCLQQGLWNFAMETIELTYSPSVTPAFGYTYAFDKPTDWVRTARVSDDEGFCGRLDYKDQVDYWFANPDTIYVKYVSKAVTRGLDLSLWTPNFTDFVESTPLSGAGGQATSVGAQNNRFNNIQIDGVVTQGRGESNGRWQVVPEDERAAFCLGDQADGDADFDGHEWTPHARFPFTT